MEYFNINVLRWVMEKSSDNFLTPTLHIALIMAVAEILKGVGVPHNVIPLIDIALGMTGAVFMYEKRYGLYKSVVIGLIFGLSACGMFSGIKNVMEGIV